MIWELEGEATGVGKVRERNFVLSTAKVGEKQVFLVGRELLAGGETVLMDIRYVTRQFEMMRGTKTLGYLWQLPMKEGDTFMNPHGTETVVKEVDKVNLGNTEIKTKTLKDNNKRDRTTTKWYSSKDNFYIKKKIEAKKSELVLKMSTTKNIKRKDILDRTLGKIKGYSDRGSKVSSIRTLYRLGEAKESNEPYKKTIKEIADSSREWVRDISERAINLIEKEGFQSWLEVTRSKVRSEKVRSKAIEPATWIALASLGFSIAKEAHDKGVVDHPKMDVQDPKRVDKDTDFRLVRDEIPTGIKVEVPIHFRVKSAGPIRGITYTNFIDIYFRSKRIKDGDVVEEDLLEKKVLYEPGGRDCIPFPISLADCYEKMGGHELNPKHIEFYVKKPFEGKVKLEIEIYWKGYLTGLIDGIQTRNRAIDIDLLDPRPIVNFKKGSIVNNIVGFKPDDEQRNVQFYPINVRSYAKGGYENPSRSGSGIYEKWGFSPPLYQGSNRNIEYSYMVGFPETESPTGYDKIYSNSVEKEEGQASVETRKSVQIERNPDARVCSSEPVEAKAAAAAFLNIDVGSEDGRTIDVLAGVPYGAGLPDGGKRISIPLSNPAFSFLPSPFPSASLQADDVTIRESCAVQRTFEYNATPIEGHPSSLEVSDFDGDGWNDIVAAYGWSQAHKLVASRNMRDGRFGVPQVIDNERRYSGVHAADLEGSSLPELIGIYSTTVWFPNSEGSFDNKRILDEPSQPGSGGAVTTADIDNDGDKDIISSPYYKLYWSEHRSDGSFSDPHHIARTRAGGGLAVVDPNDDGWPDVLNSDENGVAWYENTEYSFEIDSSFVIRHEIVDPSPSDEAPGVAAGDLDGDGDQDLVVVPDEHSTELLVFKNREGTFERAGSIPARKEMVGWGLDLADINEDGHIDVVSAGHVRRPDQGVAWYPNNGQGSFGPARIIGTDIGGPIHTADLNGDEAPEIVASSGPDGPVVLENVLGE